MSLITLNRLSIGYTHNRAKIPVMGEIDACLCKGELVALIGANGAGKSTLLRTLSAFIPPLDGTITYPDGSFNRHNAAELATQLAVVFTDNGSIHGITVRDVVALGRIPYTNFLGNKRRSDNDKIEKAMKDTGILHLAARRIETLSDGERQKTMIAKALAQDTPVIMLDEPTAFLDFGSRIQLFRMLKELAHETGKAILVSTHDLELALQLADKLWLIHENKMFSGNIKELLEHNILKSFIEGEGVRYDAERNRIEIL